MQSEEPIEGTPLVNLKAYLPVAESSGFTEELRMVTAGRAFPQCVFDHWRELSSDPLDPSSKAGAIVEKIRIRKGLNPRVPPLENFLDKLLTHNKKQQHLNSLFQLR